MKNENKKRALLDELAYLTGNLCLSDLHYMNNRKILGHTVRKIPPQQYSVAEWNDAINYILQIPHVGRKHFFTTDDARNYMINFIHTDS